MHILAFNSSPRDNRTSKTELVLQNFLAGARRAGAATETLYLRDYKIKHCLGCFSCWTKTLGRCVQKDDMAEELFGRYVAADLAVLATPLYHYTMNARMKMFVERTMPMHIPDFVDPAQHPREGQPLPRVVVISVCGFPAQETFRGLTLNMQMIFGDLLVAEIYRHTSEAMGAPPLAARVQEVLAAVSRAGEELVRDGKVKPETLAAVTQHLAPPELLSQLAQEFWQREMGQGA